MAAECVALNCYRPQKGNHRLCGHHQYLLYVKGMKFPYTPLPTTEERFLAKISDYVGADGCWWWIGAKQKRGVGLFKDHGREVKAHRYMYELIRGPLPKGYTVDHLCENRSCVNPEHLEAVTNAENTRRYWARRRGEQV